MEGEDKINTNTSYRSYLLRLWHEKGQAPPWRVMLKNIAAPGEQHYFKDLESLIAYLSSQLDDTNPQAASEE